MKWPQVTTHELRRGEVLPEVCLIHRLGCGITWGREGVIFNPKLITYLYPFFRPSEIFDPKWSVNDADSLDL